MTKDDPTNGLNLEKVIHPTRPDLPFFLPKENKELIEKLNQPIIILGGSQKLSTTVLTLLPKTLIQGNSGIGYFMINVDGFRYINAYVISDPLNSTTQRGFTLELSFSVNDFVYGVGVIGETSYFFDLESFYDPGNSRHRLVRCESDYLSSTGGLPFIGGPSQAYIVRVPVMGPYVRASIINEDNVARNAEVKAYLTT